MPNRPLAENLGLEPNALEPEAAALFSGNQLPEEADPIAMAYAGHEFGVFVPRLGDGRAILLGELRGRDGVLRDVQLKGAGRTFRALANLCRMGNRPVVLSRLWLRSVAYRHGEAQERR